MEGCKLARDARLLCRLVPTHGDLALADEVEQPPPEGITQKPDRIHWVEAVTAHLRRLTRACLVEIVPPCTTEGL
jgi:hypothetical protein